MSGLIFFGSPPRACIASRMAARSTTAGTPVRSCRITRAGVNWISVSGWGPGKEGGTEMQFTPARVILQDLTGVPAVVDLAAMREAMRDLGGDPTKINPLIPAELVIDHS